MSLRGHSGRSKAAAETTRFLLMTAGGVPLAVHADAVQGLLTVEEAGAAESLVVQGRAYAPLDLAVRLGVPCDRNGPDTRVVLLTDGDRLGNMRVAQVQGLKEFEGSRILPLPPQFRSEERQWFRGVLVVGENIALILNLAWLLPSAQSESEGAVEIGTRSGVAAGRMPLC